MYTAMMIMSAAAMPPPIPTPMLEDDDATIMFK